MTRTTKGLGARNWGLAGALTALMVARGLAGDYPRRRAAGHAAELDLALASIGSSGPSLRNLAPQLSRTAL